MRIITLITFMALATGFGCQRHSPEPELPDYETALKFSCNSNLSEYFGKATLKGQQLCYSTNDAFYKNFAYGVTSLVTGVDSAAYTSTQVTPNIQAEFGVGGLGAVGIPPAPVFFSIKTPDFSTPARQYFLKNLSKGAELNILSTEKTSGSLEEIHNLFVINMFAQYDVSWGKNVGNFQTWSGSQDPATAYLKVLEMKQKDDCTFDMTFGFRCKLYDNGRFYAEVTDGMIRTNMKL